MAGLAAPRSLLETLAHWVKQTPEKPLYSFVDNKGEETAALTYASLTTRSGLLAQKLLSDIGVVAGDRVLLVYEPSLEFIVAFFACLRAGLTAVPCFPPDPRGKSKDLHMFTAVQANSGASVVLTSSKYQFAKKVSGLKAMLSRSSTKWPELRWVVTDTMKLSNGGGGGAVGPSLPDAPDADGVAFLQYTSGSTSEPKGVVITHANLAHNLAAIVHQLRASPSTVVASWLPQYHDMGLIGAYLGVIYCGGSGVYMSPLSFLRDPTLWMRLVSQYGATHLQAPNFAYGLVGRKLAQAPAGQLSLDLSSVQHMINAAEPCDVQAMDSFTRATAPFGLDAGTMFPTYGLAEHCVFVCDRGSQRLAVRSDELEENRRVVLAEPGAAEATDSAVATRSIIGCGIPNREELGIDVRIVDPESREELSADCVGEIWVNSPSKARGYWGLEERTREEFHCRLAQGGSEDGYLRTGDLGFLHNDELFVCGREKDLIIIRGRNHFPQDLERCVEREPRLGGRLRPGCCAAFSVPRMTGSGTEEMLVIIAELRDGAAAVAACTDAGDTASAEAAAALSPSEVAQEMVRVIARDHGVTLGAVVLLKMRTVPKTTSGKIARKWCRDAFVGGTLSEVLRYITDGGVDGGVDGVAAEGGSEREIGVQLDGSEGAIAASDGSTSVAADPSDVPGSLQAEVRAAATPPPPRNVPRSFLQNAVSPPPSPPCPRVPVCDPGGTCFATLHRLRLS